MVSPLPSIPSTCIHQALGSVCSCQCHHVLSAQRLSHEVLEVTPNFSHHQFLHHTGYLQIQEYMEVDYLRGQHELGALAHVEWMGEPEDTWWDWQK
jgi:hypothetical protein